MKKSYTIKKCINPDIKQGDKVRVWDGSGISHINNETNIFIGESYPKLTGYNQSLNKIDAVVIQTGITDNVVDGILDYVYLQDIMIKIGNGIFRTCSEFVTKK